MPLELINNRPQPPGRLVVSKSWDASEGALPSWLTLGNDATDASPTTAFNAITAGVPGYSITSAVQSSSNLTTRRRSTLMGPIADFSKMAGWRFRVCLTGGAGADRVVKIGVQEAHNGTSTKGVILQQDHVQDFAVVTSNSSGVTKGTRMRWLPPPVRHDLTFWGLPDGSVYVGSAGQVEWGWQFASSEVVYDNTCRPSISFATRASGATVNVVVHKVELDFFYA